MRDRSADGNLALLKIDEGIDLNQNGQVDHVTPGSVQYGFEKFVTTNSPGYSNANGNGAFNQVIDSTSLAEGYHFIEARAFRERSDNGPEIYTPFKRVLYVDRLKPQSSVASFDPPNSSTPTTRDLIVRSDDKTADRVHVFLNLPANLSDSSILALINSGNRAGVLDRDLFKYTYGNVQSGNNVATIVTYEITGNVNVQRVPGVFIPNGRGRGLGDLNGDGTFAVGDVASSPSSFENILYSQNSQFNPAADLTADGRVDNRDLFSLPQLYFSQSAPATVQAEMRNTVVRRGDMDLSSSTTAADIDLLYTKFGQTSGIWRFDLDVDGVVGRSDVDTLVRVIFLTEYGDANLDRTVNISDFAAVAANFNQPGGWAAGDFDGTGQINISDFALLASRFNFVSTVDFVLPPLQRRTASIPEPSTSGALVILAAAKRFRAMPRR